MYDVEGNFLTCTYCACPFYREPNTIMQYRSSSTFASWVINLNIVVDMQLSDGVIIAWLLWRRENVVFFNIFVSIRSCNIILYICSSTSISYLYTYIYIYSTSIWITARPHVWCCIMLCILLSGGFHFNGEKLYAKAGYILKYDVAFACASLCSDENLCPNHKINFIGLRRLLTNGLWFGPWKMNLLPLHVTTDWGGAVIFF